MILETSAASLMVNSPDATAATIAPIATGSGGGTFAEGSSRTVTATPNSGHAFLHWTKNSSVVSTSPIYTRKLAARTVPSLHRAIRSFLHILKPWECAHYYKHAGYAAI
jgi:Divergent InlB B-repeat domain